MKGWLGLALLLLIVLAVLELVLNVVLVFIVR